MRPEHLRWYRQRGWNAVHIGEDPVLHTGRFSLEGSALGNVRRQVRKLEKAGLRSACDVMIVTAMKDWIDEGLAFDDLEIKRMTVRISAAPGEANGTLYDVREKSRVNKFANGYLGISMGLSRR